MPTDEVLDTMGIQSELDLMGLFQGVGLPFQSDSAPVQMPNMVWLYRVPILLYWAEHEETLGHIITHVLVHEIGHHFGLSDDDMYGIERGDGITGGSIHESRTARATAASSPSKARPTRRRSPSAIAPIARPARARRSASSVPIAGDAVQDEGRSRRTT